MDPYETLIAVGNTLLGLAPCLLWCAFWLWAVKWKKAWQVLGQGGWAPLVLLVLIAAAVWSRINPDGYPVLNGVTIPNFWWQLVVVLSLTGLAFFCGWLQEYLHQTPHEIPIEVAPEGQGHHHHGHH